MARLQSGDIINFILGKNSKSLVALDQIVNEAKDIEDIFYNHTVISEALTTYYKLSTNNVDNKWREGLQGGAIAGMLVASISPAIAPAASLSAGIFRIFSGVALGGTSAVILNETKKHCCNPIKKREAHMNVLLDMAKNKLIAAENRAAHVKS